MQDLTKLTKDNALMDQKIFNLLSKIKEFEKQNLKMIENENKFAKLYELGIIDSNHDYVPFHPNEGEDIS